MTASYDWTSRFPPRVNDQPSTEYPQILPGVGHTPWLEEAAMVCQALRPFIKVI
jgi:hypothetical protein